MANNGLEELFDDAEEEDDEDELYTELDEERREELDDMVGLKVLGIELWEESLADEEDKPIAPEDRDYFDCDLFLDEQYALELYVASVYPDPEGEPLKGMDAVYDAVGRLSDEGMALMDFDQADDEGGLYVAFGKDDKVAMVIVASAWMVSEWEPEDEEDGEDEEES
jgi:hypothetical protein